MSVKALSDNMGTKAGSGDEAADATPLEDVEHVTTHSVTIGGERFDYTAKTGRMVMHSDDEVAKPQVALFYTAYLRKDVEAVGDRPLIFLWNGGPGSSAIWLHMFSIGPRRIAFERDPLVDTSRWEVVENEHSLLDQADLVFLDPPCTGFSRMAPGEDFEQFRGVDSDAAIVGEFVNAFVEKERRGHSPIVLMGESYGTLRTPAVTQYLQHATGLFVDGVVLLSSLMDTAGATFSLGTKYGAVGMLPSYAATALYHGVIEGELSQVLADAEDFAVNELSVALLKGSRLGAAETARVAGRMAELTGLPAAFLEQSHLTVTIWRFMKTLLRDRGRTVGRLDTRFLGIDADVVGEAFEDDPSHSRIYGPAVRAFGRYVREDLGWDGGQELRYRAIRGLGIKWKARESEQLGIWTPQLETATQLRGAMNAQPQLKVLLQSGIYDLGTPYFPAELTFDHLHLSPERAANVTKARYEAGHMLYLHEPSLTKMKADLTAFLATVRA